MLKIIKQKIKFVQADITKKKDFVDRKFNFITFSLVLEHIENLSFIFQQITKTISKYGFMYIGEIINSNNIWEQKPDLKQPKAFNLQHVLATIYQILVN